MKYSPSGLESLELCPCYESTDNESSAAHRGTALHKLVSDPNATVAQVTTADVELDDADLALVSACLEEQKRIIQLFPPESQKEVFSELKVKITSEINGTLDWLVISEDTAVLVDWKFGSEVVTHAGENIQGQSYALGVFKKFPNVTECSVEFYMPALNLRTESTYTRSNMQAIELRILSIAANASSTDKRPTPDAKACRYCSAKARCTALRAIAVRVGGAGLPLPQELAPGAVVSGKDRARMEVLADILEDWSRQVKGYNKSAVLEDGVEIPGFTVASRAGGKEVVSVPRARQLLHEAVGISDEQVLQACSLSLPKIADVVSAERGLSKKAAREQVDEILKDILVEKQKVVWLQKVKGMTYEEIVR